MREALRRATPLLLAAGVVALAGCKIPAVEDNRFPDTSYLEEIGSDEKPPGDAGGEGVGKSGGLSPAKREALKYLPSGYAGSESDQPGTSGRHLYDDAVRVEDRWRIGFPAWDRGSKSDSPYDQGAWWDPYHQNVLKGDYALPGTQNTFLNVEATSLTRYEFRKVPTPSSVFAHGTDKTSFFGQGNQTLLEETLLVTADLFQGETSFKPVDWRFLVRGAFNWNYSTARENLALFADPSEGRSRRDEHAALQQAFFETTIASISDRYDVIQVRIGTQLFNSDFKGFLFVDEALGARFFGSFDDNLWQWNVGWFRRWEKDTNSGLNTFDSSKQHIFLANVYRQDILALLMPRWKSESWSHGLTSQVSFHLFTDDPSVHYDENDFLVRPRAVGTPVPNDRRVKYYGWTNDGHVGRLNVTSAFYYAEGDAEFDEIAGRGVDVEAKMAALELSVDVDWMRFRVQGFYQSGDENPEDDRGKGFDAIFDNPNFAGGEFSFWNRNTIRLTGSGVGLNQRFSLLNSLRSSKDQGAPSYVNPGLILAGVGFDAQITPHLKLISNYSYLRFDDASSIQYTLNQDSIGKEIGYDLSVGFLWRPLLTDNVIVKTGFSALVPMGGFRDIYGAETLYAYFGELILTW